MTPWVRRRALRAESGDGADWSLLLERRSLTAEYGLRWTPIFGRLDKVLLPGRDTPGR